MKKAEVINLSGDLLAFTLLSSSRASKASQMRTIASGTSDFADSKGAVTQSDTSDGVAVGADMTLDAKLFANHLIRNI